MTNQSNNTKQIKGWPLNDPYPYRDRTYSEPPDCNYVKRDKEYAKTANIDEMGSYKYIMRPAWQYINELSQKVQELEDHIKWLKNIGGENLNFACGVDIMCREMAIKKSQSKQSVAP